MPRDGKKFKTIRPFLDWNFCTCQVSWSTRKLKWTLLFTILLFLTCFSLKRYLSLLVSTSKECLLLLYPVIKYSWRKGKRRNVIKLELRESQKPREAEVKVGRASEALKLILFNGECILHIDPSSNQSLTQEQILRDHQDIFTGLFMLPGTYHIGTYGS